MTDHNENGSWFFSPPIGPSLDNAKLEDVLKALTQDDEYWSTEAPATEEDYCRENWARLTNASRGQSASVNAVIYYVDQGLFTVSASGTAITKYPEELTEEERKAVPSTWFDLYPVVSDEWSKSLEVRRQGDLYRYPRAILVDRNRLSKIIRCFFEVQSLDPKYEWIMEMQFAKRFQRWFYIPED